MSQALIDNPEIQAMYAEAMRQRRLHGLPIQTLDEGYCNVAQRWVEQLATTGEFRHGGGEEIISWDSRRNAPPESPFAGWMKSAGHRAWLLSKGSLVGFGIARTPDDGKSGREYEGTFFGGEYTSGTNNPPPPPQPPARLPWWLKFLRLLGLRVAIP